MSISKFDLTQKYSKLQSESFFCDYRNPSDSNILVSYQSPFKVMNCGLLTFFCFYRPSDVWSLHVTLNCYTYCKLHLTAEAIGGKVKLGSNVDVIAFTILTYFSRPRVVLEAAFRPFLKYKNKVQKHWKELVFWWKNH